MASREVVDEIIEDWRSYSALGDAQVNVFEWGLGAVEDNRFLATSKKRRKPTHKIVRERRVTEFFNEAIVADSIEGLAYVNCHRNSPRSRFLLIKAISNGLGEREKSRGR